MKDLVFCSTAFGDLYTAQQDRLKESILAIYPNANIMFWREALPPGSKPMNDSLYGFKVHAINEAKKHFSKVLWLDPAMILVDEVDILNAFEIAVVKDDNLLYRFISDKCLQHFGCNRDHVEINKFRLVGGSLYYFDFDSKKTCQIFEDWYISETFGLFGSQKEAASEQINGHRNDEACMAMALYMNGVSPIGAYEVGYCIENNTVFIKKHFK